MKSVILPIQPKWCELIANGKKTVEVRKTRPKLETPFKVYIYATDPKSKNGLGLCLDKGMFGNLKKVGLLYKRNYEIAKRMNMQILSGKVIGEFVCNEISELYIACEVHDELPSRPCEYWLEWDGEHDIPNESCMTAKEIMSHLGTSDYGYAWRISDLIIYDKPRELSEFKSYDCSTYIENGLPLPAHELKRPLRSWRYVKTEITYNN